MIVLHLLLIALGVFMIVVAVFNWDTWFYDAESRVVEMIGGETLVRWYWGIAGLVLIASSISHWIWGDSIQWPRW